MENIPVFGEVEKKRELYTPLKEKYEAAVEADQKAQNALTTATTTYNTYLNGDYKLAKDAVDNFQGEKESTKKVWVPRTNAEKFPEFTAFYDAIYELPTENLDEEMWWGYVSNKSYSYIIFARNEIKGKVEVTSSIKPTDDKGLVQAAINGKKINWYSRAITPIELYEDEEEPENDSYNEDLEGFKLNGETYVPELGVLFYEEPDQDGNMVLKAMQYTLPAAATNAIKAFVRTYDNLTRKVYDSVETTETTKEYQDVLDALATAEETLAGYDKAKTDAENDAEEKAKALTDAETAKDNAVKAFNDVAKAIAKDDPAQYDEDDLIVCEPQYTTIEITNSFEITDEDSKTVTGATQTSLWTEWYTGYTLNGNGYSINSTRALFRTNNGTIENLANTDGSIASSNKGDVFYCLTRRNSTTCRAYHSSDDFDSYENVDIEDIIYQVSGSGFLFGYDAENGIILPLTDDTRLYAAQYTNAEYKEKGIYQFKLNIKDGQLKWNKGDFNAIFGDEGKIADNSILYIDDIAARAQVEDNEMENVAVKVGDNIYNCYNTVLKDGRNEDGTFVKEFYIPKDFTSKKLTYMRNFKEKVSAVCLPFKLNDATKTLLKYDNTFQFSNVDTNTGVMWFTTRSEIGANKPCLISFKEAEENRTIFANITSSLDFMATPDELVAVTGGSKEFYGTYASCFADDLTDNSGEAVYGIQDGWLKKANPTARIHHFRSYVKRPNTVAANEAPSYKIGLMDEDGNELSTAIETVTGEIISGFKVKGSNNAIEVSTDEACQVKVYSLNGALVKSTRVEAGTTSLPVKAGIYVVNGVKVIVK